MRRSGHDDVLPSGTRRRGNAAGLTTSWRRASGRTVALLALVAGVLGLVAPPAAAGVRPHPPGHVIASLTGPPMRAVLTWSRSERAGRYRVFRNGHLVAHRSKRTRYVDRTVWRGKRYVYFIKACNDHGCSAASARVRVTTPRHAPRPPSGVQGGS